MGEHDGAVPGANTGHERPGSPRDVQRLTHDAGEGVLDVSPRPCMGPEGVERRPRAPPPKQDAPAIRPAVAGRDPGQAALEAPFEAPVGPQGRPDHHGPAAGLGTDAYRVVGEQVDAEVPGELPAAGDRLHHGRLGPQLRAARHHQDGPVPLSAVQGPRQPVQRDVQPDGHSARDQQDVELGKRIGEPELGIAVDEQVGQDPEPRVLPSAPDGGRSWTGRPHLGRRVDPRSGPKRKRQRLRDLGARNTTRGANMPRHRSPPAAADPVPVEPGERNGMECGEGAPRHPSARCSRAKSGKGVSIGSRLAGGSQGGAAAPGGLRPRRPARAGSAGSRRDILAGCRARGSRRGGSRTAYGCARGPRAKADRPRSGRPTATRRRH